MNQLTGWSLNNWAVNNEGAQLISQVDDGLRWDKLASDSVSAAVASTASVPWDDSSLAVTLVGNNESATETKVVEGASDGERLDEGAEDLHLEGGGCFWVTLC